MLNKHIEKLAKLTNSAILTPYNLLENIHLNNYLSINYSKEDGSIVADIVFLEYNKEIKFRYIFDDNNYLQKIYHINGEELIVHFDRDKEKEELTLQLKNKYSHEKNIC